jgi:RNA polymerase sigma factor (sigma-70 family)
METLGQQLYSQINVRIMTAKHAKQTYSIERLWMTMEGLMKDDAKTRSAVEAGLEERNGAPGVGFTGDRRFIPGSQELLKIVRELVAEFRARPDARGTEPDELLSVAWLEATRIAQRFDPYMETGLKAFLRRRVRGALIRHMLEHRSGGIRPLEGSGGRFVSGVPRAHNQEEEDQSPDPEQLAIKRQIGKELAEDLARWVEEAPPSMRKWRKRRLRIFLEVSLNGLTCSEVARRIGVSPARVREILRSVKRELGSRRAFRDSLRSIAGR